MNEQEWRDRYRSLAEQKLPDTARRRILSSLSAAAPDVHRTSRQPRPSLWWMGAGALTAGLVVLALVTQRLAPNVATGHPAQHRQQGMRSPEISGRGVPATATSLQSVDMLTVSAGWTLGANNHILRTADGGRKWLDATPRGLPTVPPYNGAIAATNPADAWLAVATDRSTWVYRTTDGGATWQRARISLTGQPQVSFLSASTGYLLVHLGAAAGSEGVALLRTTDGGARWRVMANARPLAKWTPPLIFAGDKSGFAFRDPTHGWLTGEWAANSILLDATSDGGRTWRRQPLPVPAGLSAQGGAAQSMPPAFFGSSGGVLPVRFGNPGLPTVFYQTTDGGATWTPTTPVYGRGMQIVYAIVDQSHIVATNGTSIFRTANGGRTWTSLRPDRSLKDVTQLDFVNPADGFAVDRGVMLRTTDGGRTWVKAG